MQDIYPDNFESKTGFDRIRELLKLKCLSLLGKECVDEMSFISDFKSLSLMHSEVDEFCRIIREFDQFPVNYYFDSRAALKKIEKEGFYLELPEVFDLKRSLESIRAIVNFFKKQSDEIFPVLKKKAGFIQVFPFIYDRIDSIITKNGQIKDSASSELSDIRKNISTKQSGISKRLHSIMKQAQANGIVEKNTSINIRDGRSVIPVSPFNKRKIKGIIYDESATGKTVYIEPTEIVEMNNEIRELENEERREIIRILINLSSDIRPYIHELILSYKFLGEIDFIRCKALFAIETDAKKCEFSNTQTLDWKNAIHPLLMFSLKKENREIIPLDIRLSSKKHILLISGPNAGGKSVCLKTVGLLQYMLQCGMLIPVNESSKTGIFNQIFIDIGDEQSIENDLSTYSSHLLNMKHFIKFSNHKTLILIDEFGTGTEPQLGGAIAESILKKLNKNKTFGVITTHYSNLKHFASSEEGIENGAMMYDSQKMAPLFKLDIGKPGSSFAFEIARKIGLSEEILQDATEKVGKKHIDFDKNLKNIIRDKKYWEDKRKRIRKVEKILDGLATEYEKGLIETEKQRKEILKKAREEASEMLSGVNKQIENTIAGIRESQAEKEKTKKLREKMESLKKEISENEIEKNKHIEQKIEKLRKKEKQRNLRRPEKTEKPVIKKDQPEKLKIGDSVKIKGQETIGELVSINKKNAVVAFGQLMTTIPGNQIEKISNNLAKKALKGQNKTKANIIKNLAEKKLRFKSEIDIRGMRTEEALQAIQDFIDDAIMLEQSQLRILHGKGNGILKETIRDFLRAEPLVRNFKDEHVQFGGSGITIVNLEL